MNNNSKPLLLIFPFGLLSHYLRCLVIARHLNHFFKIKFAYHHQYCKFIENAGFSTFHCNSINEEDTMERIKNFDFTWLNEQSLEQSFLSQVNIINQYKPIAILGDAVPSLKMAAEYTNVYYISLFNGYMSRYYANVRSLPIAHPLNDLLSKLPDSLKNTLTEVGEAMAFKKIHKPFRILRNRYGLKAIAGYLAELEGNCNFICDLGSLFPQNKAVPYNYRTIGPLIYDDLGNNNKALNLDTDKKTIFISMGSTGNWDNVEFMNDNYYSRYNIITAGDNKGVLKASHIVKYDFISAKQILPFTDLVICHGGNGTIYQALSYGIPLLCIPSHFEQEWNINAIKNRKLGDYLLKNDTNKYPEIIAMWISGRNDNNLKIIKKEIASADKDLAYNINSAATEILASVNIFNKNQPTLL